jgi:hypothetical protein
MFSCGTAVWFGNTFCTTTKKLEEDSRKMEDMDKKNKCRAIFLNKFTKCAAFVKHERMQISMAFVFEIYKCHHCKDFLSN